MGGKGLPQNQGSILLAVLVVVALLSLGAYTFTEVMVAEAEGTAAFTRGVQARLLAESGVERVCAVLAAGKTAELNLYENAELFQHQLVLDQETEQGKGYFSVVAPDAATGNIRFGLVNESAKLNLNALLSVESSDPNEARERLLHLPNMTEELADCILDWLDEDDSPRDYGAESEYYLSLSPSYQPRNGPLHSLDELLLVEGVTPELLYGEDANRNGLLDPNEDDGDLSPPPDNADGQLDRGWIDYLTVDSRETNLRPDGSPKINLNAFNLADLYDQLEEEFGEEVARFVVAYRIYGPKSNSQEDQSQPQASEQQNEQQAQENETETEKVSRGGLDLSRGGSHRINSIFDLVSEQVQAEVNGEQVTLTSPWTDDPNDMSAYLPLLEETLTTVDQDEIEGRVNIDLAPLEVLLTVPGMTEELADSILGMRTNGSGQSGTTNFTSGTHQTVGWLYTEGLVSLNELRKLAPYITTGGNVFRVQVVGYFGTGVPFARLEAVVDASRLPPKILRFEDLSRLGRGFRLSDLTAGLQ